MRISASARRFTAPKVTNDSGVLISNLRPLSHMYNGVHDRSPKNRPPTKKRSFFQTAAASDAAIHIFFFYTCFILTSAGFG